MEPVLVLYHPIKDELELMMLSRPYYQADHWLGRPFCVWRTLEIALERGWLVIGEL